uniref:G protein beta subunit-like n=1 Tax=Sphaeramia orbicularis TaxID=375764 RepID=A0A673ALT0_9TELE
MDVKQDTVESHVVILVTAGYDHTVKFWQVHAGMCGRTVHHQESASFTVTEDL